MYTFEIAADLCDRLTEAEIPYMIGGSVAAGVWGEPRATNDIDLAVWLSRDNAAAFIHACREPFYVHEENVFEAIELRDEYRMVQVMQLDEVVKFDFFLQDSRVTNEEAYLKAIEVEILPGRKVKVACAEDILVQKLRWYELGNRVSKQQWRDMKGIVANAKDLDWPLIERWARGYRVDATLKELRAECGV